MLRRALSNGIPQALEALDKNTKQLASHPGVKAYITLKQRHIDQKPFICDILKVYVLANVAHHSEQSRQELMEATLRLLDRYRADEFESIKLETIGEQTCFKLPVRWRQRQYLPCR